MGFCPRCGKPTEHKFCTDCLRKLHPLVEDIKPIRVTICPVCLRTFSKSSWSKRDVQQFVVKEMDRAVAFTQGSRIDDMLLEPIELEPGKQDLALTVIGSADAEGEAYEEYYTVTVLVQGNRCKDCERAAGTNKYFVGILQLRRPNDIVQTEIERLLAKVLSDVKDVTGGVDYFVSDHHILQNVARQIHTQFGGELTIRAQHFSYDPLASKNLYRVNACIRLPKYWKGSLIRVGNKLFLITNMGKMLKGIDIMTGKSSSVPADNDYEEIPVEHTTIVTVHPSITILDPQTYQTISIMNARDDWKALSPGDKVIVAMIEEQAYLVSTQ